VLLVTGGAWLVVDNVRSAPFQAAGDVPTEPAPVLPSASTPARVQATTQTRGAEPLVALPDLSFEPTRLVIDSMRVSAPVVPVGVDAGGGLTIPDDPATIGWWRGGAAPGSPVGTTLVAGHVDSARLGRGALFHLSQAPIGTVVTISADGHRQSYRVTARRRYLKKELPWRSLFAQTAAPRLVLVTCGGNFDHRTRHYTDNVVVLAVPTEP
jgi:hypothetical protein